MRFLLEPPHTGPEFKKRFKNLHNPLIKFLDFFPKNPERVDCGGIFISKFYKKNQKLAEINKKSSDPLKRGWSDYGKTHPRWVVMLPSKGIYPLFRGKHLTKGKSKSDFTYFWPFLTLFEWSVEVLKSFLDHTLIWQLFC